MLPLSRPQLRKKLKELYPSVPEFLQFLIDYLPDIARRVNAGMDRIVIENITLESVPEQKLSSILSLAGDPEPAAAPRALFQGEALEALVGSGEFIDVPVWLSRLEKIMAQICLIEVAGTTVAGPSVGTGFLIGPDLLLTNYHVVDRLLASEVPPSAVRVLFDYHGFGHGSSFGLADAYRVADSPMSPVDREIVKSRLPSDEELDFAVLRLNGSPGSQPAASGATAKPRGFLRLDTQTATMADRKPLFILQHPQGKPLKMHIDLSRGENENGTRLRYTTNTLPGSSGAPCFDAQLCLVALHHSRDPSTPPQFNEGIPIRKIVAALKQKGISLPL